MYNQNDYCIVIVEPYRDMVGMAKQAFEEHTQREIREGNAKPGEYTYRVLFHGDYKKDILTQVSDADVVIARGIMYHVLARKLGARVVELQISSYDIIALLDSIKKAGDHRMIGAVGTVNMFRNVEKIGEILGLSIKNYIIDDAIGQDVIDRMIADGCDAIIGSYNACAMAKKRGVENYMIYTGKQSLVRAISEAKQIAKATWEEQENSLYIKGVLDYASEGIMSIDPAGQIKSLNMAAEKLLGISSGTAVGKGIEEFSFPAKLKAWMLDDKTYVDEIVRYHTMEFSLSKAPMINQDEHIGNIITFQDITKLQKMEELIHKRLRQSGHVTKYAFPSILYQSRIMEEKLELAKQYAQNNLNVMITGESGTGKEMFAQSIHNFSARKDGPFVAINCAALPESLLESELFGYVEGAFTGAAKGGKAGLFELAHGGTIFLDEISELPHKLQGRLLRVLQEGEIMRLGNDKITRIDVRIISATNKNLKEQIKIHQFREDIYYRLNVLRLNIPPLRKRKEDIPLLIKSFFQRHQRENAREPITLTEEAMKLLCSYNWPGNVRELMNCCDRLAVIARGDVVGDEEVYRAVEGEYDREELAAAKAEETREGMEENCGCERENIKMQMEKFESKMILEALKQADGNQAKAARMLGMSRSTFWRKLNAISHNG